MKTLNEILNIAKQRAAVKGLPYTGELTPREAFDMMQQEPATVLVDVRSRAELELVGKVPQAAHIEWAFYPGMVANAEFAVPVSYTHLDVYKRQDLYQALKRL